MLLRALLAPGQFTICKVEGWRSLGRLSATGTIDLTA